MPNYLTNISEACYINNIKKLFDHTNKRIGFEKQLFKYNIRHLNISAIYNIELFSAKFRHKYIKYALRFYINIISKKVLLNYEW